MWKMHFGDLGIGEDPAQKNDFWTMGRRHFHGCFETQILGHLNFIVVDQCLCISSFRCSWGIFQPKSKEFAATFWSPILFFWSNLGCLVCQASGLPRSDCKAVGSSRVPEWELNNPVCEKEPEVVVYGIVWWCYDVCCFFLSFLVDLACGDSGVGIILKVSLNIPSGKLT